MRVSPILSMTEGARLCIQATSAISDYGPYALCLEVCRLDVYCVRYYSSSLSLRPWRLIKQFECKTIEQLTAHVTAVPSRFS